MRLNIFSKITNLKLFIPRIYNGIFIKIPLQDNNKVGISNEPWMYDFIKKSHSIKRIKNFYDVGANLGQTLVKVKTVDKDIHYHAFEPNYLCSNYLHKLIDINNWKNVSVYPIGIFDRDSLQYLEGKDDCDKSASIMLDCSETTSIVKKITSFYTYDTIKKFIGEEIVDVIKIDTEGSELEVIRSFNNLLKKDSPLVFIEILKFQETNKKKITRDKELCLYIKELDYSIFRIKKDSRNHFETLIKVEDVGTYKDNIHADHVLIKNSKIIIYKNLITDS